MFGHAFFGVRYFGPSYWGGPAVHGLASRWHSAFGARKKIRRLKARH